MSQGYHRVRTNHWINGILRTIDHGFYSLEEAVKFAEKFACDSFKIFDSDECVVYSGTHCPPNYAQLALAVNKI